MNANQLFSMISRMILRRAVSKGVNAGIDTAIRASQRRRGNGPGPDTASSDGDHPPAALQAAPDPDEMSPAERKAARRARRAARRARQAARAARRASQG